MGLDCSKEDRDDLEYYIETKIREVKRRTEVLQKEIKLSYARAATKHREKNDVGARTEFALAKLKERSHERCSDSLLLLHSELERLKNATKTEIVESVRGAVTDVLSDLDSSWNSALSESEKHEETRVDFETKTSAIEGGAKDEASPPVGAFDAWIASRGDEEVDLLEKRLAALNASSAPPEGIESMWSR